MSESRQFVVRVLDVAQGAGALLQVDDQPPRWLSKDDVLAVTVPVPSPDAVLLSANAFHAVRAAERRLARAVEDGTPLIEGVQDALAMLRGALREVPVPDRWAGFDDEEVDELHYGLIEAESEDSSPDSNSRRRRLMDELEGEAERRRRRHEVQHRCSHDWDVVEYGGVPVAMVCSDCGAKRKVVSE